MQEIDLIFQHYYRPLCLYATHYLHDIDEAEDVVQDCFVKLISRSIMPENIKAFLYTSVRNACIDRLRRQSPIDTEISPSDLSGTISDNQARWHDLSGDCRGTGPVGKDRGASDFQGFKDLARQERGFSCRFFLYFTFHPWGYSVILAL